MTTPSSRTPAYTLLAVTIGGVFFLLGQSIAARYGGDAAPAITVQGVGRVFATPDVAVLNFGVNTGRQPTAQRALEVLTENMNAIIAVAQEQGIEERDVSTQYLWLNPAYDWINGEQVPRGFEATQNLSVKVRDIERIGSLLTAAAGAGANQIGGVTMTVDNPEELQAQAREQAIADAREKAGKLARDLGISLGRIVSFTEGVQGVGMPEYYRGDMGMGGGGGLPTPAGEQEIVILVTVGYGIR